MNARCFGFVIASGVSLTVSRAWADPATAAKARDILTRNCGQCHIKDSDGGIDYMNDLAKLVKEGKVTPGDPAKTKVLLRIASEKKPMPPTGETPRPNKDEIDLLTKWVREGAEAAPAEAPPAIVRKSVSLEQTYAAARNYLDGVYPEHYQYQRFFTLAHLHNDLKGTKDDDLRLIRAAVSKVLNSLSWKRRIVIPQIVAGTEETLLAIDLRDIDWDYNEQFGGDLWRVLLKRYPYGLKHDRFPQNPNLNRLADQVYKMTYTQVPIIRADWFVARASQPPLYHDLLGIPETSIPLEKRLLGTTIRANFARDKLLRAGWAKSGVSSQNRMVERHEGFYGAFWKSYDFKDEEGKGNLKNFPLGPQSIFRADKDPLDRYARFAFKHDGGEIIFHLPNGLQGYMLVNGQDGRIDIGPAEVVKDKQEWAGKGTQIINGLSCMACHAEGMIRHPTGDEIAEARSVGGEALDKVRRIYRPKDELDKAMARDSELFVSSVARATGPYLQLGNDAKKPITAFAEPVGYVAKRYLSMYLRAEDAAIELDVPTANVLAAVRNNADLAAIGLRTWATPNGRVSRGQWDECKASLSAFQTVAREMELGDAVIIR
ncbi:MAG: hypothetical protein U0746_01155 [Gemmataceae bacterium]